MLKSVIAGEAVKAADKKWNPDAVKRNSDLIRSQGK
jgi:hypothetical protein